MPRSWCRLAVVGPIVASSLACAGFGDEPAADVSHPQPFARSGVSFDYPGNWTIGGLDGVVAENGFTVESPGGCLVMFLLFDGLALDADELLAMQVTEYERLVSSETATPFGTWGPLEGRGTTLDGNIVGLLPGTVRVFAATPSEARALTVVEQCYDENVGAHPGFALVERTFRLE